MRVVVAQYRQALSRLPAKLEGKGAESFGQTRLLFAGESQKRNHNCLAWEPIAAEVSRMGAPAKRRSVHARAPKSWAQVLANRHRSSAFTTSLSHIPVYFPPFCPHVSFHQDAGS